MGKKSVWFGIVLVAQLGILASLPLSRDSSGRKIWLPAKAANLQSVMRGSGLRLHYDIAQLEERRKRGETVYVALRRQADSGWDVAEIGEERPSDASVETVVIRGKTARHWEPIHVLLHRESGGNWRADSVVIGQVEKPFGKLETHQTVARASVRQDYVDFGIGHCDIPERLRKQIVEDIQKHPEEFAALVNVDLQGRASLLGFRVQDREFKF